MPGCDGFHQLKRRPRIPGRRALRRRNRGRTVRGAIGTRNWSRETRGTSSSLRRHDNDGGLAERRGSGLQSRRHRFESGTRLSGPGRRLTCARHARQVSVAGRAGRRADRPAAPAPATPPGWRRGPPRTARRARRRCAADARGPVGGLALTCLPAALGEHREHPGVPGRRAAGRGSHTDRRGRRDRRRRRHRTPSGGRRDWRSRKPIATPPAVHRGMRRRNV